jgi:hypothetical protein
MRSSRQARRGRISAALIACLAAAAAIAAAPVVTETITPSQIAIGESAELRITSPGSDIQTPKLPVVPGLEFRVVEQLQGVELVHGATLATTTTVVRVTPQIVGTFVIPETESRAQPLVLRVSPATFGGGAAISPHGITGDTSTGGMRMTADGSAFIRLSVERREVYVGERVPLAIELGLRASTISSLNGLPSLAGTDFTLNDLSRAPDRRETSIDGVTFLLLTWHTVLTPVKPGAFSLVVEMPLTVRVSTRPAREAQLEDQLGDPFMQRRFGAMVRKDIKASSPPLELTVDALPADGRPPEFSGAVGSFGLSSEISSTTAAAGDPLTLRMHVTGSGNFDRVDSPMLEHVEHWKTYPPTSSFKPGDASGFKGEKVFEQPVIAQTPGEESLPGLVFAYFDPSTRRYETLRTAPLSVAVSASAADGLQSAAGTLTGATARPAPAPAPAGLKPDSAAPGVHAASLVPLYLRPSFLALPSLLTVLSAGAWFKLRARSHPGSAVRQREHRLPKEIGHALAQMEQAARAGDGARFFALAKRALQELLAVRWQTAPESITAALVESRLEHDVDGQEIRRLFALADEAIYAGRTVPGADLARWTELVRRQATGARA